MWKSLLWHQQVIGNQMLYYWSCAKCTLLEGFNVNLTIWFIYSLYELWLLFIRRGIYAWSLISWWSYSSSHLWVDLWFIHIWRKNNQRNKETNTVKNHSVVIWVLKCCGNSVTCNDLIWWSLGWITFLHMFGLRY